MPRADEAGRGVVPREHQQEAEAEQLLLGELLAVDLGGEQRTHQVVTRFAATLGQQFGEELVALAERVEVVLRTLDLEERVGPAAEVVDAVVGDADHRADHHARQDGRVLVLQLAAAAGGDAFDEVARDGAGARFDLGHAPRRERTRHERAQLRVADRVDVDHLGQEVVGLRDHARERLPVVHRAPDVVEA